MASALYWDAHWRAAARELTDTVGGKARKA
jgi:hypothetical protein